MSAKKKAKVELLANPYDLADGGQCVRDVLIRELSSKSWTRFRAAVAFAQKTGNDRRLISAIEAFSAKGHEMELTFGADTFANGGAGSEYEAIKCLLERLELPNVKMFLYREPSRTFHPKVYLFDNPSTKNALAIIGSSNWSLGGHVNNIEANVVLRLGRGEADQTVYRKLCEFFEDYWQA